MTINAGESLDVNLSLENENGVILTDISALDVKMMLANRCTSDYDQAVTKDKMTISNGVVSYRFTAEETKNLLGIVDFELKVTQGDKVMISRSEVINVVANKIKDA